jgi:hypothetical protein
MQTEACGCTWWGAQAGAKAGGGAFGYAAAVGLSSAAAALFPGMRTAHVLGSGAYGTAYYGTLATVAFSEDAMRFGLRRCMASEVVLGEPGQGL